MKEFKKLENPSNEQINKMLNVFFWFERTLLSEKTALNKMNKMKTKELSIHEG